jgi:uncharacterized protein YbjT (DUF2867 family)
MARVLIVGCGGRGQALARVLTADGHAVRGTTRDPSRAAEIEAAGAEAYLADPDRIATLMDALPGVTVVCWLMGTADSPDLHDGRLRMLCEKLVDTGVRGLVYEAAGSAPAEWLQRGAAIVRRAQTVWNIPVEVLATDPADCDAWMAGAREATARLLALRVRTDPT